MHVPHNTFEPFPVGSTIGIIGAGQLAKMMIPAISKFGYTPRLWSETPGCCALDFANNPIISPYDPHWAVPYMGEVSAVTYESENVPAEFLQAFEAKGIPVRPSVAALRIAQDRILEKELSEKLGIPFAKYWVIEGESSTKQPISYPVILKTARGGYDGKGQRLVRNRAELQAAWADFGKVISIAEAVVNFQFEFSIVAARDVHGTMTYYDPFQNVHKDGILHETIWPERHLIDRVSLTACAYARSIADELNVVGVITVEFFYTKERRIVLNEIAPRVHNSGHITIDCAATSQFEQHIRAISGQPLGDTRCLHPGRMVNIIGDLPNDLDYIRQTKAQVHLYGKNPRKGRKLGHVIYFN